MNKTKTILEECASYFHHDELYLNCFKKKDCKTPLQCLKHDAVYNILNYLTSATFFPPEVSVFKTIINYNNENNKF